MIFFVFIGLLASIPVEIRNCLKNPSDTIFNVASIQVNTLTPKIYERFEVFLEGTFNISNITSNSSPNYFNTSKLTAEANIYLNGSKSRVYHKNWTFCELIGGNCTEGVKSIRIEELVTSAFERSKFYSVLLRLLRTTNETTVLSCYEFTIEITPYVYPKSITCNLGLYTFSKDTPSCTKSGSSLTSVQILDYSHFLQTRHQISLPCDTCITPTNMALPSNVDNSDSLFPSASSYKSALWNLYNISAFWFGTSTFNNTKCSGPPDFIIQSTLPNCNFPFRYSSGTEKIVLEPISSLSFPSRTKDWFSAGIFNTSSCESKKGEGRWNPGNTVCHGPNEEGKTSKIVCLCNGAYLSEFSNKKCQIRASLNEGFSVAQNGGTCGVSNVLGDGVFVSVTQCKVSGCFVSKPTPESKEEEEEEENSGLSFGSYFILYILVLVVMIF